ncbi:MAG TPA: FAD-dependent oxidoreductase [Candidatus Acidoferrales bacterium]|nr:FAD-dependent oxidoreductase [Candidatus Acidoferrales bacterium]
MRRVRSLVLAVAFAVSAWCQNSYDLVVYGGTAGGAITAVSGARMGLRVALLEPRQHIGGMVSGGLSRTDVGRREVIGGYALEFYWRAGNAYDMAQHLQEIAWLPEPHVAESIFREMLRQAGVTVLFGRRLREHDGVRKAGTRLESITMENGETYTARVFADCTYEGDLMAQAGVTFTWGRESTAQYGESLAGVRGETPKHQFLVDLSPYDAAGKLLPEISAAPPGEPGAADRKVQAYNFRMILSHDPANQVAYARPDHYDPGHYELFARLLAAMKQKQGRASKLGEVISISPIPNQKADMNNNGAFSTDYIGKSWEYPNASYARRAEIWRDHEDYTKGFFWFLAHDPRVPADLQREANEWGLAKDEFTDNQNFPNQLYIREARRMAGEYVMTQKDIQTDLTKPDPIGMGSYNSDSHNIQRIVTREGFVRNEGDMQVPVQPYQIPYRVLTPKRTEAQNLLVPVCFSASHVAYSTLRMEPQYMILAQAAGVAASMAIRGNVPVQSIDTGALTRTLVTQGAILEYKPDQQSTIINRFRR